MKSETGCYLSAAVSGSVTALSFSSPDFFPIVFFSLIPLFFSLRKTRRAFLTMMIYSLSLYCSVTLWLSNTVDFLPFGKSISFSLILVGIIVLSLFQSVAMSLPFIFFGSVRKGGISDAFVFSSLYALGESFQEIIPVFSFPWARLSCIVTPFTEFIQTASLFGGLFTTFLIALMNSLICVFVSALYVNKKKALHAAVTLSAVFIANTLYGIAAMSKPLPDTENTAILVQGNFSGTDKRSEGTDEMIDLHISLADSCDVEADVIVFSETSLPEYLGAEKEQEQKITELSRRKKCPVITGVLYYKDEKHYNAMVSFDENGNISEPYLKRKPVPFGEYIPMRELLSEIIPSLRSYGFFSAGCDAVPIGIGEHTAGGVICFESIFPEVVRDTVDAGAEVIVIISNDSWFGEGSALYQHHAHAIMRAVENGRYTLRSSSTAVTSCISPYGKITATATPFKPVAITVGYSYLSEKTLFSLTGNIIALPFLAVFVYSFISFLRDNNLPPYRQHSAQKRAGTARKRGR